MLLGIRQMVSPFEEPRSMISTAARHAPTSAKSVSGSPDTMPFASAEEAWLWTMGCLMARRDGARSGANKGLVRRPCEPDDVVKCLDMLYRQRGIDLLHGRILRVWGERQAAPSPAHASEKSDWRIWREAIERLEWPLRLKGIVA
jgi:hypothetical protein